MVLEKTLESLSDSKEIKPINPKGNLNALNIHWEDWIFIAEAEAPILWPPDAKKQLTGKDLDAGKDWGQEETAVTENMIVEWHYDSVDMSLSKLWEVVKVRGAWCDAVHWVLKSWTWLSDWTTTICNKEGKTVSSINDSEKTGRLPVKRASQVVLVVSHLESDILECEVGFRKYYYEQS